MKQTCTVYTILKYEALQGEQLWHRISIIICWLKRRWHLMYFFLLDS